MMQMKRNLTLSLLILSALYSMAQNEDKSITLGEVVVKAAKTVNKMDGMVIYPTDVQKKSSSNGYDILQSCHCPTSRLMPPHIKCQPPTTRAKCKSECNGIVAGRQEMLSLDPKSIARIDFINNPGVHYGDNIAYVIDITTRRADNGYTIGNRHHRHSHFSTRRRHRIRQVEQRQERAVAVV